MAGRISKWHESAYHSFMPIALAPFSRRQFLAGSIIAVALAGVGLSLHGMCGVAIENARRVACASNLKNIALGCQAYANKNDGRFPDRFEDLLLKENVAAVIFV